MPGRDGTGPLGREAMTGRGLGLCRAAGVQAGANDAGRDRCLGRGRGLGGGCVPDEPKCEAENLPQLKSELEQRLTRVNARLEQVKHS